MGTKKRLERLPYSSVQEHDAIEKYFCIPFENSFKSPLTSEDAKLLISISFLKEDSPTIIEIIEELSNEKSINYSIFTKRIFPIFQFKTDNRLLCYLSAILKNPGDVVMFGTYLAYWAKRNKKKILTMEDFNLMIFPFGFPQNNELDILWHNQKIQKKDTSTGSDNLLDYAQAGTSLMQPKNTDEQ